MKVQTLIELLKTVSPSADVYVWHDGDCHEIQEGFDCLDISANGLNVQINVKNSHDYQ
jgi:hypothetical protein